VGEEGEDYPSTALFHVTWSEDGRCDWGVIDIAICLDVWMDQLSGWSGSLWQSICQDFLLGSPGRLRSACLLGSGQLSTVYLQEYVSITPRWRSRENVVVLMEREQEQQKWNRFRFRSAL
jgi:hypothetical protein